VSDPNRRVGGVHRLAARPARPEHVDAQVLVADLDLDLIRKHRQHLDTGKRRLTPLLLVGGADAHEPVNPDLGLEHPKGVAAVHGEDGAVDAEFHAPEAHRAGRPSTGGARHTW
jgi:hypothetical protein